MIRPIAWLKRLFGSQHVEPIGAFSMLENRRAQAQEAREAPPADDPDWLATLPARLTFIDVETTGLHSADRVVSLAAIRLKRDDVRDGQFTFDYAYLLFDPGRKSHPGAEAVHGWDDWTLRHQPEFPTELPSFEHLLREVDLIVAHNSEFDMRFVERELALAGRPPLGVPTFCTMQRYRAATGARASLDAICARFGWPREKTHGALEDAFLCMRVFLALHRAPHVPDFPDFSQLRPANFIEPPVRPDGPLPRRKRRVKAE